MPSNGRTGTRGKRKGRIDYRKLNQGGTAPKPDGEEKKEKKKTSKKEVQKKEPSSKSKSKSIGNCELGSYLIMLYVTLEQERALMDFFQGNGWPFLKPDLSSLTEKSGSTLLASKNSADLKQMGNKTSTKQSKNVTKHDKEEKMESYEEGYDLESDDDEQMDSTDALSGSPSRKRARKNTEDLKSTSSKTTVTPSKLLDTDNSKLDGTESVADIEDGGDRTDERDADQNEESDFLEENIDEDIGYEAVNETADTENKVEDGKDNVNGSMMEDEIPDDGEVLGGPEPVMRCWECNQLLKDEVDYTEHMLKEHSFDVKSGHYYCSQCDKHFKQPNYLRDHIKHIHEGIKRRPQKTTRDHICEICGRGFKRNDQLKEHRSMVHFKKPLNTHECNVCGKKFSRPRLLGYHMNKHVGNKPFKCTLCGNSYYSRGGLYVHSRMCQRENPSTYECDTCNKQFPTQYARKAHVDNVHGKDQTSYRCGCGKLLKWKTSLKKHLRSCHANGQNVMEISREEFNTSVTELNEVTPVKDEIMETGEIIYTTEDGAVEHEEASHEVTEVTDERLVEEITGKIADELSKSGKVDSADEKMLTETIRNAVLSGEETQVITIPRPSGSEENVYYVIVNPGTEEQF